MAVWQSADLALFPTNYERQLFAAELPPLAARSRPILQPTRYGSRPFAGAAPRPTAPRERAEKLPNCLALAGIPFMKSRLPNGWPKKFRKKLKNLSTPPGMPASITAHIPIINESQPDRQ
jgi:hypothetical protein